MIRIPIQTKQQNNIDIWFLSKVQTMKTLILMVSCFLLFGLTVPACQVDINQNSVLVDLVSKEEVPPLIDAIQVFVDGNEEALFDLGRQERIPIDGSGDDRVAFFLDFAPEFQGRELSFEIIGLRNGVNVLSTDQETAFIGNGLVEKKVFIGFCGDLEINDFRNEECEDGNFIDGDNCDSNCTETACENGIASPEEICYASAIDFPGQRAVAVGDLDNDGSKELIVVGNNGSVDDSRANVLQNDGNFNFVLKDSLSIGTDPRSVAVGDFNEDNNLDIVSSSFTDETISILFNDGLGNFLPRVDIFAGGNPSFLEVIDINKDNHLDIIMRAENGVNDIRILLGDGTGDFPEILDISSGGNSRAFRFLFKDFDNNGDIDIASTTNSGEFRILFNLENTQFSSQVFDANITVTRIASEDFDSDGDFDIVVADILGNVEIFFNSGNGEFSLFSEISLSDLGLSDIRATDLNNDQHIDLVVLEDDFTLFLNDGSGQFSFERNFAIPNANEFLIEDLNSDLVPDLITTNAIVISEP